METPLQLLRSELNKIQFSQGDYKMFGYNVTGKEYNKRWKRDTAMILKYKRAIEKLLSKPVFPQPNHNY